MKHLLSTWNSVYSFAHFKNPRLFKYYQLYWLFAPFYLFMLLSFWQVHFLTVLQPNRFWNTGVKGGTEKKKKKKQKVTSIRAIPRIQNTGKNNESCHNLSSGYFFFATTYNLTRHHKPLNTKFQNIAHL